MLALARTHADSGIALEQLDVVEPLLHCVDEVLQLKIFVEVDEIFSLRMIENRIRMVGRTCRACDRGGGRSTKSGMAGCFEAGTEAIEQAIFQRVDPVHPARRKYAGGQCVRHE